MPGKRGPKYKTRRASEEIEKMVLEVCERGCNKFEINNILQAKLNSLTSSLSGIYNILKRHGKNRLGEPMKEEKRRIIKEKTEELAHIDCHHLSKDTITNDKNNYYIVCVIDAYPYISGEESF